MIIGLMIIFTMLFTIVYKDFEDKLEKAKKTTSLPDNPDYKKINEFIASVNERIVKGEV